MILDMALECAPEFDFDADAVLLEMAATAAINADGRFNEETRVELGVRLVDEAESARLNGAYRHRPHPTNVLSFPADAYLPGFAVLGDLVICGPVITREATTQGKTLDAHLSHMVVHGVLHLLGFDHIGDDAADTMESMERRVLAQLGYDDPYRERAY